MRSLYAQKSPSQWQDNNSLTKRRRTKASSASSAFDEYDSAFLLTDPAESGCSHESSTQTEENHQSSNFSSWPMNPYQSASLVNGSERTASTSVPNISYCDIYAALQDLLRRVRRRQFILSITSLVLLIIAHLHIHPTTAATTDTRRSGKLLFPLSNDIWQLDSQGSSLVLPSAPSLADYRFYDASQPSGEAASLSPAVVPTISADQNFASNIDRRYHQAQPTYPYRSDNNYSPYAENAGIAYKLPFMSTPLDRRDNLTPDVAVNYNSYNYRPPHHHRNRHRLQTRQIFPVKQQQQENVYSPVLPSPPQQMRRPYENAENEGSWQRPPLRYASRPPSDSHQYDITFESLNNNADSRWKNDVSIPNRNRQNFDETPNYVLEKRRSQIRPSWDTQDQRREPSTLSPRPLTSAQRRQLLKQQYVKFRHRRPTTTTPVPVESPDVQLQIQSAQVYDENFAANTIAALPPPPEPATAIPTTTPKSDIQIKVLLSDFYNRYTTTTQPPFQQPGFSPEFLQVCQLDEQCVYARDCADIDNASSQQSSGSPVSFRSCTIVGRDNFGQLIPRAGGICCPIRVGDDILSPISTAVTTNTIIFTTPPPPAPTPQQVELFTLPAAASPPKLVETNQLTPSASSPDYEAEDHTISPRRAVNILSKRVHKNWYAQTLEKYYSWLRNKWRGGSSTAGRPKPVTDYTTTLTPLALSKPVEPTFGENSEADLQQQNSLTPNRASSSSPSLLETIQKAYHTYLVSHPSPSPGSGSRKQELIAPLKFKTVNSQYICGERKFLRSPRILGGRETLFGEWPWTAIVNVFGKQRCGGALVNERFVVTAAHCLYYFSLLSWFPGLSVVVGEHNRNDETRNPLPARSNEVEAVYLHPDYVHKTKSHDVALIKLKTPIEFVDNIQPVCLPSREYSNRYATVMGWGKRSYSDTIDDLPDSPYQVDLQIHSRADCIQMLRKSGAHLQGGYGEEFSCAGGETGKDACRGDSGGPLMIQNVESGQFELVGLVSKGFGCGEAGIPGIYTNLLNLRGWIEQTVKNNS